MAGLSLFARQLDRFAARSAPTARARAERLAEGAPVRALALFAVAADAGDVQAAFETGECYFYGRGTLRHPASAARWYQRAAEAGHVRAQCRLARLHLFGLPEAATGPAMGLFEPPAAGADYPAALLWARRAAEAGDAEAQAILGHIHTDGPEALRDPDAAFHWYASRPRRIGRKAGLATALP